MLAAEANDHAAVEQLEVNPITARGGLTAEPERARVASPSFSPSHSVVSSAASAPMLSFSSTRSGSTDTIVSSGIGPIL
jgi:hypothetical protein